MSLRSGRSRENLVHFFALSFVFLSLVTTPPKSSACTTAAWLGAKTKSHAPIIWKNRDTSSVNNRVIFADVSPYKYIGLTDAHQTSGRAVYAGLNEMGLAIVNSVAYNLPRVSGELSELEGFLIADVLRTAKRVEDFESYLDAHLGPDLGVRANFLVFDSTGQVWLYEVHNNGYKKFSVADDKNQYLINTNFSRSGSPGKGSGYLRFDRVTTILKEYQQPIDAEFIFNSLAKDLGHTLMVAPTLLELRQKSFYEPLWYPTTDTISRDSTASSVMIQGQGQVRGAGEVTFGNQFPATMWVSLGEPVASLAIPVWVESGRIPQALSLGSTVPLQETALGLKKILRPFAETEKQKYLNLTLLHNKEGLGIRLFLDQKQTVILKETEDFLTKPHSREEFARFQENMAELALASLKLASKRLKSDQS